MFRPLADRALVPFMLLCCLSSFALADAQEEAVKDNQSKWFKPVQAAPVLDRDVYDQEASPLMDKSVPEMLSSLGSPHAIYRNFSSKRETWVYFVVPKSGAPYTLEMLVKNGRIETTSRHFLADFVSE